MACKDVKGKCFKNEDHFIKETDTTERFEQTLSTQASFP